MYVFNFEESLVNFLRVLTLHVCADNYVLACKYYTDALCLLEDNHVPKSTSSQDSWRLLTGTLLSNRAYALLTRNNLRAVIEVSHIFGTSSFTVKIANNLIVPSSCLRKTLKGFSDQLYLFAALALTSYLASALQAGSIRDLPPQ